MRSKHTACYMNMKVKITCAKVMALSLYKTLNIKHKKYHYDTSKKLVTNMNVNLQVSQVL